MFPDCQKENPSFLKENIYCPSLKYNMGLKIIRYKKSNYFFFSEMWWQFVFEENSTLER